MNFEKFHPILLKGLNDHDLGRQIELLDYLHVVVQTMIELTENERVSRKKKKSNGIGDI